MRRRLFSLLAITALMASLGGCGSDDADDAADSTTTTEAAANELTVTGTDYAFAFEGKLAAGLGTLDFKNAGKEDHMMAMGRIKDGKTFQDVLAALKDPEGDFDAVAEEVDGIAAPQILSPGGRSTVTTTGLAAGSYAVLCFVAAPDGEPHLAKGMAAPLTIDSGDAVAQAPATTGSIKLQKDAIAADAALLATGKGVFEVTTDAEYDLAVVRLEPGKTVTEVFDYFESKFESDKPPAGPAPGGVVSGVSGVSDKAAYLTLDLPPGSYGLVGVFEGDDEKKPSGPPPQLAFTVK